MDSFAVFSVASAYTMSRAGGEQMEGDGATDWMGLFFPLFAVPFILIGIWMLSAPVRHYRSLQRTVYALTNTRAIILSVGRTVKSKNYPYLIMENIRKVTKSDGYGSIYFASEHRSNGQSNSYSYDVGFENIRDVKSVERDLMDLKDKTTVND